MFHSQPASGSSPVAGFEKHALCSSWPPRRLFQRAFPPGSQQTKPAGRMNRSSLQAVSSTHSPALTPAPPAPLWFSHRSPGIPEWCLEERPQSSSCKMHDWTISVVLDLFSCHKAFSFDEFLCRNPVDTEEWRAVLVESEAHSLRGSHRTPKVLWDTS